VVGSEVKVECENFCAEIESSYSYTIPGGVFVFATVFLKVKILILESWRDE